MQVRSFALMHLAACFLQLTARIVAIFGFLCYI